MAIHSVESMLDGQIKDELKRFYAIKLLESDDKIVEQMASVPDVSSEISSLEETFDDDVESIITNERYSYITSVIDGCLKKAKSGKLTISDKIDKIVTNRILALPIFAVVMFIVYYVSVTTVGTIATDWANDGVFGDGWHLFGIGTSAYEEDADSYTQATNALDAYGVLVTDDEDAVDVDATKKKMAELDAKGSSEASVKYEVEDEETLATNEIDVYYDAVPDGADEETVTLDETKVPEGMVFDLWSTGKFELPLDQDYKAESIAFTMNGDVDVAAQYRSADIEDGSDIVGPIIVGTAVVAGGALVGYTLGTDLVGQMWGLPYFPSNRSALAMMLWEDAGKPMPESEILYPDVGQEEQDMDLQHAARWAMEHDLLPDLNDQDTELPPEQVKFYPDNMVTKIGVLRAWKKAQDLKQNAQ